MPEDEVKNDAEVNVEPKVEAQKRAAECAGAINDVLTKYGFMLSVTHEIVSNKDANGKLVLDVDHQIRFVEK